MESQKKIKVEQFEINYLKIGNGPHCLLLMPNTFGSIWSCFKKQIEGFDRSIFTMVVWDPPGYGKSRPPDRDFSLHYLEKDADYAYEFMKALEISSYSVLGWCAGGRSAMILAAKHPEVVKKLVVWSTNSFITSKELDVHKETVDTSTWPAEIINPLLEIYGPELLSKYSAESVKNMTAILEKRDGNICSEFLKDIRCPTLILYGFKDRIVDSSHLAYLSGHIRNSSVYIYPDGKHRIHITHADDFNILVQQFLEPELKMNFVLK